MFHKYKCTFVPVNILYMYYLYYECTIKMKDKDMFLTPSYNSFLHPLKLSLPWLGYEYPAIHLTFDLIDGRLGFD